jgi:hypothetical protein
LRGSDAGENGWVCLFEFLPHGLHKVVQISRGVNGDLGSTSILVRLPSSRVHEQEPNTRRHVSVQRGGTDEICVFSFWSKSLFQTVTHARRSMNVADLTGISSRWVASYRDRLRGIQRKSITWVSSWRY